MYVILGEKNKEIIRISEFPYSVVSEPFMFRFRFGKYSDFLNEFLPKYRQIQGYRFSDWR